ncbi:hypothetical protein GCM10027427_12000 [Pseudoclavibacter terrae]|uniref:Terminase n=1 Tax=Pseudoclavibacter terrae TaxID=1530195 RepID=A0A7J5B710_9MICO|nr:terminase [Pseudoclavibacter terrae]
MQIPEGIVSTIWPSVQKQCARFGVGFDQWQDDLGELILARREDGQYACSVGGAVLSIPRQTGKTYTIGWLVFALCTMQPNMTVIWTAHRTRTANETFQAMRTMAKKPGVASFIESVRATNGEQEVAFVNGSRILFGAREQGFGRGFAEVDVLVLDEAQILTEDAMSDMVPATNAAANGLVIMMGTPPRPKDPGAVFAERRRDALANDPDTLFVEFSADRDAQLDDWVQLAKANPSFPHRTGKTAILRMRKLLGSDDSFRREAYGIWDEVAGLSSHFKPGQWSCLYDPFVPEGSVVFGVKFSVDGALIGVCAAVKPREGPIAVSGIRLASTGEGFSWFVELVKAQRDHLVQVVIDGRSGVSALIEALDDEGFKVRVKAKLPARFIRVPTLAEYQEAHVIFERAVQDGELSQDGSATLLDQISHAVKRPIGTQGGYGWGGIGETDDVTLLDSGTLAVWGARTTTRRANRKVVIA